MTYVHVCDIVLMVTKVNQSILLKVQLSSNTSVEITHTICLNYVIFEYTCDKVLLNGDLVTVCLYT